MSQYMTTIKELAKFVVEVVDTDRDAVIVISGDTGEGKSVLNWHLSKELTGITGIPYDPTRNMIFDRDELKVAIDTFPEYSCEDVDEAVGIFYARDFHDEEQIALLKKLDRARYRHQIIKLLIPSIWHIDSHLRNARVRIWIHVDSRKGKGKDGYAHAFVFKKEKNPFNADPWNTNENRKLFARGRIDKSPNYMGEIMFYDMDPTEKELYQAIKEVKRAMTEAREWKRAVLKKRRGEKPDPAVVTV